jgi:hypothetical protein
MQDEHDDHDCHDHHDHNQQKRLPVTILGGFLGAGSKYNTFLEEELSPTIIVTLNTQCNNVMFEGCNNVMYDLTL